jgi:hypothetical protein
MRMFRTPLFLAIFVLGGLLVFLTAVRAQEQPVPDKAPTVEPQAQQPETPSPQEGKAEEEAKKKEERKKWEEKLPHQGSIVVAPLPNSSPAIGSGIVPVLGYIFPFSTKDKISPPSTIGAAGLITDNGSRGFGVGGQLFLKEDRYEITSAYVHGNINYNIYGTGIASNLKLPLEQTGEGFFGEFLRRVAWKFFVGPRFVTGRSFLTVRPTSATSFPIPEEVGIHDNLTSLGVRLLRDTRPDHFYPVGGTYFTITADFFSQTLGSKYSFQSYKTKFDKYWSLSKNQVLAYEGYFCATGGQPPFYGNCIYGTNNELRGYTAGQYFSRYMLATQLEYRLALPKRFGLVVFGGLGGVIPEGHELSQMIQTSHFLPGGGAGLRFELSKKYHVNLRADIAQGVNGHTFGVGVGEAF